MSISRYTRVLKDFLYLIWNLPFLYIVIYSYILFWCRKLLFWFFDPDGLEADEAFNRELSITKEIFAHICSMNEVACIDLTCTFLQYRHLLILFHGFTRLLTMFFLLYIWFMCCILWYIALCCISWSKCSYSTFRLEWELFAGSDCWCFLLKRRATLFARQVFSCLFL